MTTHGINDSMFIAWESFVSWISSPRISSNAYKNGTYETVILVTYTGNYASKLNEGLRQRL